MNSKSNLLIWTLAVVALGTLGQPAKSQDKHRGSLLAPLNLQGRHLSGKRILGCADCDEAYSGKCSCGLSVFWSGWGAVDYLMGWSKGRNVPALVTTSDASDEGVAGASSTSVLMGNERVGLGTGSGGRVDFGAWLGGMTEVGLGMRFYGFSADGGDFQAVSDGSQVLALPFYNTRLDQEDARLVATGPGVAAGEVSISNSTNILQAESYLRIPMTEGHGWRFDLVGGYHYSRVEDRLTLDAFSEDLDGSFLLGAGNTRRITDVFDATNDFHGGSLGLLGQIHRDRMVFSMLGKISGGNMHQKVRIEGRQENTSPAGSNDVFGSGTFALNTNTGRYERDVTAVIPEAQFTFTFLWRENVSLNLGYAFSYWSDVVTATDSIDRNVNSSQFQDNPLFGSGDPQFTLRDTDFWVQGMTIGITLER